MLKYLIVLLSDNSTSFCYYKNDNKDKSNLMPYDKLLEIIEYSGKNGLYINFLYNEKKLPDKYEKLIDTTAHVKILPAKLDGVYENSITIFESSDISTINNLPNNSERNIILRLEKKDLPGLNNIFNLLLGKFKKLNLNLIDIQDYKKEDLEIYKNQLDEISEIVISEYKKGNSIEINFLSDRLLLNNMNNCNAGIEHATFAPNGKFYICPGFYYDDEKNDIGDIKNGINIQNKQLLELDHAPICSICDAYQCKRCIYLNKKTTLEINTPSYQQCILSHYERNASKKILDVLKNTPGFDSFKNFNDIPQIDYLDPLKVITGEVKKKTNSMQDQNKIQQETDDTIIIKNGDSTIKMPKLKMADHIDTHGNYNSPSNCISVDEFAGLSTKDMLIEIFKMQKEILKEFNK